MDLEKIESELKILSDKIDKDYEYRQRLNQSLTKIELKLEIFEAIQNKVQKIEESIIEMQLNKKEEEVEHLKEKEKEKDKIFDAIRKNKDDMNIIDQKYNRQYNKILAFSAGVSFMIASGVTIVKILFALFKVSIN